MAAHLIYRWNEYTSDENATFEKAASELIAFTQQDVRGKIVRRLPLLVLAGLIPKAKLGRTDLLEQFYDKFYGYTTLHELRSRNPTAPALHILTTNLSSGQLCSFTPDGFCIDSPEGKRNLRDLRHQHGAGSSRFVLVPAVPTRPTPSARRWQ